MQKPLDLANISHSEGGGGGRFRELMNMLEAEGQAAGYDGVFVEQIMNDFLPEVLARYGYTVTSPDGMGIPQAYKRFRR